MRVGIQEPEWASERRASTGELILEQAARARSRRQWRRAIALYRQVLTFEPNSVEIHERLAPLLAATRQEFDA
jgi:hypothetical protein